MIERKPIKKAVAALTLCAMLLFSASAGGCASNVTENDGRYGAIFYDYYVDSNGVKPLATVIGSALGGKNITFSTYNKLVKSGDTLYGFFTDVNADYADKTILVSFNVKTKSAKIVTIVKNPMSVAFIYKNIIVCSPTNPSAEVRRYIINLDTLSITPTANYYCLSRSGELYYTVENDDGYFLRLCGKYGGTLPEVEYKIPSPSKQMFSLFDVYGDCVVTNDYVYEYASGSYTTMLYRLSSTLLQKWYKKTNYTAMDDGKKIYLEADYEFRYVVGDGLTNAADIPDAKKTLISVSNVLDQKDKNERRLVLSFADGSEKTIPKSNYDTDEHELKKMFNDYVYSFPFGNNRAVIYNTVTEYNKIGGGYQNYCFICLVDGETMNVTHIATANSSTYTGYYTQTNIFVWEA